MLKRFAALTVFALVLLTLPRLEVPRWGQLPPQAFRVPSLLPAAFGQVVSNPPRGWNIVVTTTSGTVNNWNPGIKGDTWIRYNGVATGLIVTGFPSGYDGQQILLTVINTGTVSFNAFDVGSSASNRLVNIAQSGLTCIMPSGSALFQYDSTVSLWRLLWHEQGAWYSPAYDAADYIAGNGLWTVSAGDVGTRAFMLRGRTLTVAIGLYATTLTVNTSYTSMKIPGGFGSVRSIRSPSQNYCSGGYTGAPTLTGGQIGLLITNNSASSRIDFYPNSDTSTYAYAAQTDTCTMVGEITFEVS